MPTHLFFLPPNNNLLNTPTKNFFCQYKTLYECIEHTKSQCLIQRVQHTERSILNEKKNRINTQTKKKKKSQIANCEFTVVN